MGALTIEVVASVALLALGGILVIERQLSIGQLVAAELIVTAVVASIAKLGGKVEIFYDLVAAVDKLGEIFDLPLERSGGETPPRDGDNGGELVLEDIELELEEDGESPSISLHLRPGGSLSLTGAEERLTSRLVDAVFGLIPPRSGIIEIDGLERGLVASPGDLALHEVRSRIAVVRGTEILPGCIGDNLRAGNPDLSAEQAWGALAHVGLEDWVKDAPDGLETDLLADGSPLTRTQALALTIARALAGGPSVLVLDRTLDQVSPEERVAIFDALAAPRDVSILVISDEPELVERTDAKMELAGADPVHGEAA